MPFHIIFQSLNLFGGTIFVYIHTCIFLLLFPVPPSPPVLPEAVDKTKETVSLTWQPPRHDGKGKILGYLVEYQKIGEEEWKKANETPELCPETKFTVQNLEDGEMYRFKIMAVNAAGKSDPAYVKDPVKVHDRLGNWDFTLSNRKINIFFTYFTIPFSAFI